MESIKIVQVKKTFEETIAIENVSLNIKEGSFFTFLGPSGCGKTTLLRMIAGFINPEEGQILLGTHDITHIPSEKREIGMVFQNYALFPHLNVYDNVAYGLRVKRLSKNEIEKKVLECLKWVRLTGYENRKVSELSGGEQQRVALARCLVIEPKVLLLDEPLCNLDARLRDEMRAEIRQLQQKLQITTIFVTHDQKEALNLSDEIAVFNQGKCVQVGKPRDIYLHPKNSFVATFVGETNLLEISKAVELGLSEKLEGQFVSIRPEQIEMSLEEKHSPNQLMGRIEAIQFNGCTSEYSVRVEEICLKIECMNNFSEAEDFRLGQEVFLYLPKKAIKVLGE